MRKTLGTRIASGVLALLMFASTLSTTAVTALAVDGDALSTSDTVDDDALAGTNSTETGVDETVPQDPTDNAQPSETEQNPEPTAAPEATAAPTTDDATEPTTTPDATEDPSAEATPTPTPEPTEEPEPTATPEPTPEPSATPEPEEEVSEEMAALMEMLEQLPSIEDVAEMSYAECCDLRTLCEQILVQMSLLEDDEVVDYDLNAFGELYDAIRARMEETAPDFEPLSIVEEFSDVSEAMVGDEVDMFVRLNRDDVAVEYQWQKLYTPSYDGEVLAGSIFNYDEGAGETSPTSYMYFITDLTESELLEQNPDATWQGIELWMAARDAAEGIGASMDGVTFADQTPNYALNGFDISAETAEDGTLVFRADKSDEHYIATLDEDGKYAFSAVDADEAEKDGWVDIEGATESVYHHVVTEEDADTVYRCKITVVDEIYIAAAKAAEAARNGEDEDADPADENSDAATPETTATPETASISAPEDGPAIFDDELMAASEDDEADADAADTETEGDAETEEEDYTFYSSMMSFDLPETFEEYSDNVARRYFSFSTIAGNVALSNDAQWIVGVNSNYEYITADMFAQVQSWLASGEITQTQADMYWTKLDYSVSHEANVLDEATRKPTGATRKYIGFQLTDGNKMEVLSDWYGKTVYFRQAGTPGNGTPIKIPASTQVGQAQEQYKTAVTHFNAYIGDTGPSYIGGLKSLGSNGWYPDDTHITSYTAEVTQFNQNPEAYLVDAEGNFRMDSFSWGPGTMNEPDLSGRAFWCLLRYINQGYGMMIGHDTMYGYAGAYHDEWPGYPKLYYGMDPYGNIHYEGDDDLLIEGHVVKGTSPAGEVTHEITISNMMDFHVPDLEDDVNYVYRHEYGFQIVPINKDDTRTRYYSVNSCPIVESGHWNMNALMGNNNYTINVYKDEEGNMPPGTEEGNKNPGGMYFFLRDMYNDPYTTPSMILSSGGSHYGPYYKQYMYGGDMLRVKSYPYSHQDALNYARRRTPTNYPYDFKGVGETFVAQPTHSNMQVAFGNIWVDYANNNLTAAVGNGKLLETNVDGRYGTNNFYLAGNGTFLMNQIGHLPDNRFTLNEAALLVNTIMYISQRKQCEVCQSQQTAEGEGVPEGEQGNLSHFVHRVDMSNAREVLDALARGGTFWYPLNDCYLLTEDLNLKVLYAPGEWKGIKAFSGHWDSDIYKVILPEETYTYTGHDYTAERQTVDGNLDDSNSEVEVTQQVPLFIQGRWETWRGAGFLEEGTIWGGKPVPPGGQWVHDRSFGPGIALIGPSFEGEDNWSLGTDSTKSLGVIGLDSKRSTGIARVLGYLSDLFEVGQKTDYAGYTLELRAEDNKKYFSEEEIESGYKITSKVNSDGKYILSNVRPVFENENVDGSGTLRVRVFKPDGTEVTEYGSIRTDVHYSFWSNDMTTPLYLGGNFSPQPIPDEEVYESLGFEMTGAVGFETPITAENIQWQWRKNENQAWANINDPTAPWTAADYTISAPEYGVDEFDDPVTMSTIKFNKSKLTWSGYEFRVVFTDPNRGSCTTWDYYIVGRIAHATNAASARGESAASGGKFKMVAKRNYYGKLTVKPWPAIEEITPTEQTLLAGHNTQDYTSTLTYVLGEQGHGLGSGLAVKWQYTEDGGATWNDVDWSDEDGHMFRSINGMVVGSEKQLDHGSEEYTSYADGVAAENGVEVYQSKSTFRVNNIDAIMSGARFRAVWSWTTYSDTLGSQNGHTAVVYVMTPTVNSNLQSGSPEATKAVSEADGTDDDYCIYGGGNILKGVITGNNHVTFNIGGEVRDLTLHWVDDSATQSIHGQTVHLSREDVYGCETCKDSGVVDCPNCDGTGLIPMTPEEIATRTLYTKDPECTCIDQDACMNGTCEDLDCPVCWEYLGTEEVDEDDEHKSQRIPLADYKELGDPNMDDGEADPGISSSTVKVYYKANKITHGGVKTTFACVKTYCTCPDDTCLGILCDYCSPTGYDKWPEYELCQQKSKICDTCGGDGTAVCPDCGGNPPEPEKGEAGRATFERNGVTYYYSNETATYVAVLYYRDGMKITPTWQYTKLGNDGQWTAWNQITAAAESMNTNIEVGFASTDLGIVDKSSPYYNKDHDGFRVLLAVMTIKGATNIMDLETMYYFRCRAEATYTTYYKAKENTYNTWSNSNQGELRVDYTIDIKHNGFTEGHRNIVNGKLVTDAKSAYEAVDGTSASTWQYPDVRVIAPQGARTAMLQFANVNFSRNDRINFENGTFTADYDGNPYMTNGEPFTVTIGGSGTSISVNIGGRVYNMQVTKQAYCVIVKNSELLPENVWSAILSHAQFLTYDIVSNMDRDGYPRDGNGDVVFYIDEEYWANNMFYNASNGHMYQYVIGGDRTWSSAEALAERTPCPPLDLPGGYLVHVNTAEEWNFVYDLTNRASLGWLGGKRHGNNWYWYKAPFSPPEDSAVPFFYQPNLFCEDRGGGWGLNGFFNNFQPGEPNDFAPVGGEDSTHFYANGEWNDYADGHAVPSFIIEWGDSNEAKPLGHSDHSAADNDKVYTKTSAPKEILATVTGGQKIYDGIELNPTVWVEKTGARDYSKYVKVTVQEYDTNGEVISTWHADEAPHSKAIHYGKYAVTLTLDQERLNADGLRGYEFAEGSSTFAELIILKRGIDFYSHNNDKIYDGTSNARISDITAKPREGDYGIVEGDDVALESTLMYGYYSEDYDPVELSAEPGEKLHTGKYDIKALTKLALINNPYNDYYIHSVDFDGRITARPLHLHSLYHDSLSYNQTYDNDAKTLGAGRSLTEMVSYNEKTMTVKDFYEALLAGTRVDIDITRYTMDDQRNYEVEVVEPNNVRSYDNTTDAIIRYIAIDNVVLGDEVTTDTTEYAGTYETMNAGETLVKQDSNGDHGTPQEDRYNKLKENRITRTQDISLINDPYNDYYIADESYSGAIYRAQIIAQVEGRQIYYGDGLQEEPFTDTQYDAISPSDSWLHVSGLMGSDILRMADWTKRYKSEFVLDLKPTAETPVGEYKITYIGLNEDNYSVLSNYIVQTDTNAIVVNPLTILISVDESLKDYGDENPPFYSTFKKLNTRTGEYDVLGDDENDSYDSMKLVGEDTIGDTILVADNGGATTALEKRESGYTNVPYLSDCENNSDVIYIDEISETCPYCTDRDGKDREHFHLGGYAVWVNESGSRGNVLTVKTVENMYGETVQNYAIEYEPNIIKVHPLPVTIIPQDKSMVYGTTSEPELTYTLKGRRVKWNDLWNVVLTRDAGIDVYDGYVIRVESYENSSNYFVDTETALFKITPAYLYVQPVFAQRSKVYGDPIPKWTLDTRGYKYNDTQESVLVDNGAGAELDNKDFNEKSPVGEYRFNIVENSISVRLNRFNNQNYLLVFNPAILTVTPRPITIKAIGWQKPFGTPDPDHGVLITDDLTGKTSSDMTGKDPEVCVDPENAPITFDLSRADGEEVGEYPIYVSAKEKEDGHEPSCHCEIDGLNQNYRITYIPDKDIIYRSDAVVGRVNSHTRYYGDDVKEYIEGGDDEITYYLNGKEITAEEAGIIGDPSFSHTDTRTSSVGSYAVYADNVESSKYDVEVYPGYTTVIPRPVTVIAIDNEKVYGDEDPTLDFILHDGHSEDGETYYVGDKVTTKTGDAVRVQPEDLPGGVERQEGEDAGWYPIDICTVDPHSHDGSLNYDIRFVEAQFHIKPAALLVRVLGGYKKAYGDENPAFGASITGFKRGDTQATALNGEVAFSTVSQVTTPVGKYIVSAKPSIELEDGKVHRGSTLEAKTNSKGEVNYTITYLDGDIEITTLKLQIIIDHLKKVYGSEDPVFTYTMRKVDGSVATVIDPDNSPLNLTLTRTPGENVGKGDILEGEHTGAYTITGTHDNTNYEVEIIDGSLTIVPATITVIVDGGYTKTYGDPNPEFGVVYKGLIGTEGYPDRTGTGIKDDESVIKGNLVIECLDRDGKPVDAKTHPGNYPVKDDKSELYADNYVFKYVNGDLTILKRSIVIVVDDQEKTYGDEDPATFTWHLQNPEDLVNPGDERFIDAETWRPDAGTDPGEQVGEHTITGTAEPTDDYDITVVPGTETIKPATIIVTVLPNKKYYGEDNPVHDVTITGYRRGDNIDSIGGIGALHLTHEAEKWSDVGAGSQADGKYLVSAKESTFSNPNYDIVYVDGTLEILPLTVRLVVQDDQKVYGTFDPATFKVEYIVLDENGGNYNASPEQVTAIHDALRLDTYRRPGEVVNDYPIKATYTDNSPNFHVTSCQDGVFTITPAPLVITANSAKKYFDGLPLVNRGYTAEGLIHNPALGIDDSLLSVTVRGSQTQVGKSPNHPSDAVLSLQNGVNGNRNYTITYIDGELEVLPQPGISLEKEADRSVTTDGDIVTYTIRVYNATGHDLSEVKVRDTNNFEGEIIVPENPVYSYADGVFTIHHLPAYVEGTDNFAVITYSYKVLPDDHGTRNNDTLTNKATVFEVSVDDGTPPSDDWYGDSNEVNVEIIRNTLVVEKEADREVAAEGDVVNYTIRVTNNGNRKLEDILVTDTNNFTGEITPSVAAGITYNNDHTWTIAELGIGVTVAIKYSYTVQSEDLANNELDNIATGKVPPKDDQPGFEVPSEEVKVPLINRDVAIRKSVDKDTVYTGETVTYSLHITNTGNVDLDDLTVTDDSNALGMAVPIPGNGYRYERGAFIVEHLAVGESITIRYLYTVVNNDPDLIENVANVHVPQGNTGTSEDEPFDKESNPVYVKVLHDSLTVEKTALESMAKPGDEIHYSIKVTNTGDTVLHDVVVKDTFSGTGVTVNTTKGAAYNAQAREWLFVGDMEPGDSYVVTYTYTVTDADEKAGIVENTVVATGENPTGKPVPSDPDDEDVPVSETPAPNLDITKVVDKPVAKVGETITYTVRVTNRGSAAAENFYVRDYFDGTGIPAKQDGDGYTVAGEDGFLVAELGAGETLEIVYTYVIQQSDKGVITNIVVLDEEDPPVDIEKEANKNIAKVNEVVTYTITVTNNTEEAVTDLTVKDTNNFAGEITAQDGAGYVYNGNRTWTIANLASGQSIHITYTYTVETADPSTLINEAEVRYQQNGEDVTLPSNPVEVKKPVEGEVTIVKSADKDIAIPGEVVTYKVTVHNGKTVDAHDVVVTDANNFAGTITGVAGNGYRFEDGKFIIPLLRAGESVTLTYTYTVEVDDVPTEILRNIATAHVPGSNPPDPENPEQGIDPDLPIDPDTDIPSNEVEVKIPGDDTETEIPEGELVVTKAVDKAVAAVGDTLTYTVTVENTSDVDMQNVTIMDAFGGHGELVLENGNGFTANGDGTYSIPAMAAHEKRTLTFSYVVVAEDAPEVLNAAVLIEPDEPVEPHKEADKDIAKVDDVVTYTITVKNNTAEAKENLTVTDTNNFTGDITADDGEGYVYNGNKTWTIARIEAGAEIRITYTYTVQSGDADVLENQATVKYTQDGKDVELPTEPVDVVKPHDGEVTITKSADKTLAYPGDVVTYTVTVHNGRDYDMKDVRVTDANNFAGTITAVDTDEYRFEDGAFIINELRAGESVTLTYTYTVEIADVPTHILENIATATVPGPGPEDPTEDIPSNKVEVEVPGSETETEIPEGNLVITKEVDKAVAQVGETLAYTVHVSNTGAGALHDVTVKDFFGGHGTLTLVEDGGFHDNGGYSYTLDELPAGETRDLVFTYEVVAEDAPEVLNAAVIVPDIPVEPEKTADKNIAKVDEVVTYTITVRNNSGKAQTNLLVSDTNNFAGEINAESGSGYIYNGNHTWTIPYMRIGGVVRIVYTYTVQSEDETVMTNQANVHYTDDGEEYDIPTEPVDVQKPVEGEVTIVKAADKKLAYPGDVVTYTVTVHNGKNVDAKNVTVTDANNFAGTITGVDGTGYHFENGAFVIDELKAGESITLTYTYTVEIADVDTHFLDNIATAHVPGTNPEDPDNPGHGVDPDQPIDPDEDIPSNEVEVEVPGDETETEIPEGKLVVTKEVDKAVAQVGETLTYTVHVSNAGNAALADVTIRDFFDGHGTLTPVDLDGFQDNGDYSYTLSELAAGETRDLVFTYVVVAEDAPVVFNAAVDIPDEPGKPVEPEKTADKTVAAVDEVVTYTIAVHNNTEEAKTDLTVSDTNNFTGEITATDGDGYSYNGNKTWTIPSIDAGETIYITYTYTMREEDADVLVNQADVRYREDGEDVVIPTEPVEVEKPHDGDVTIVKSADKKLAYPGEVVTYTVTLFNDTGRDLHNVTVSDANNFAGTITGVDGAGYRFENGEFVIDELLNGASVTLTYTYTVEVADVITHLLDNVATAHVPGTNPEDPDNPGHGIDPDKPIDPDKDVPSNEVEVEVPGSGTETEIPEGKLVVTKEVDKAEAKVGDTLTYTVHVANTGSSALQDVTVKDFFGGHGTLTLVQDGGFHDNGDYSYTIDELPAGETRDLVFTYVVVAEDAPVVLNAAVDIPDIPVEPEKTADKNVAKAGEVVTYTITVRNNSGETKTDLTVTDTNNFTGAIDAKDGDGYTYNGDKTWTIPSIEDGQVIRITYTYTVEDADAEVLVNQATVKYRDDGEDVEIPTEPVEVQKPVEGSVTIVKAADKKIAYPGDVVTYTVTVHNGKNVDVKNVTVSDANNFAGTITGVDGADYRFENGIFVIDEIKAGESVTLTYTYTVEIADVETHFLDNIATAHVPGTNPEDPDNPGHGIDPDKPIDPDEDIPSNEVEVEVPGDETETEIPDGELIVTKEVDKATAKVGDTLTYTVHVSNIGEGKLENVTIKDFFDGAGELVLVDPDGFTDNGNGTYTIAELQSGETRDLVFTYVVQEADGTYVANAVVEYPDIPVEPDKEADKSVAKAGEVVTYTITVRNNSGETKTDITVTDHNNFTGEIEATDGNGYTYNGDGTWTIPSIENGQEIRITYTYTVQDADAEVLVNNATVKYRDNGEDVEIPTEPVEVKKPDEGKVTIVKSADKHIAYPGDVVTYKVTVHNGTGRDLHDVSVTDANNFAGTITAVDGAEYRFENGKFIISELLDGASVTLTYTYTVEVLDVPTEILRNIATAHVPGKNPEDPDNPGHGIDPEQPIDPDEDIPSNEVEVEVPGDETETELPKPHLTVAKAADVEVAEVGDWVNYTITVTNDGGRAIHRISLMDVFNGHGEYIVTPNSRYMETGNGFYIPVLDIGETIRIRYSYKVLEEDIGVLHNIVSTTIPDGPDKPEDPIPNVEEEVPVRHVSIEKTADKRVVTVGDRITYTVTVTNDGAVDVENVLVTDFFRGAEDINASSGDGYIYNGDGTFTVTYLAVGDSIDITYNYVVVDADPESIYNAVIVEVPEDPDDPDEPKVDIEKSADKEIALRGEVVTYSIAVTNDGDVAVDNLIVTDHNNFKGNIDAQAGNGYARNSDGTWTIEHIEPGETVVITYTYTVTMTDESTLVNEADVTYTSDGETHKVPSEEVDVHIPDDEGKITIAKTADKHLAKPGEVVTYTVTVHNGHAYAVQNVTVTDANNFFGTIEGVSGADYRFENGEFVIDEIPAGGDVVISYTYTVEPEDVATHLLENVATAHVPGNPEDPENPGHGKDPDKPITPDEDIPSNPVDVEVPGDHEDIPKVGDRRVDITKEADKQRVKPGDTVHYTLVVTNTGEEDLENVSVVDRFNGHGDITVKVQNGVRYEGDRKWTIEKLAVGETVRIEYSYVVLAEDADILINVAAAKIPPVDPNDPNDPPEIPSNEVKIPVIIRDLTIQKSADKTSLRPGETVTYTVRVTNTGNVALQNVKVRDTMRNNAAGITPVASSAYSYENGVFTIHELGVGQFVLIRYTYVAQKSDVGKTIINVAVATLPGDPEDPTVPDKDIPSNEVHVPVVDTPAPTPTPDTPAPTPTPAPLPLRPSSKTGVGLLESLFAPLLAFGACTAGLVKKSRKKDDDDE